MREPFAVALSLVVVAMSHVGSPAAPARQLERIRIDDNRRSAGTLRNGVLTLRLDARVGMWYPEGDDAPGAAMQAFAEVGREAQIPGPMIRVPAGTEIVVTVTNSVREGALAIHGLVSRPVPGDAAAESLLVAPGETRETRFRLDAPGTYYYWGTTTGRDFFNRTREDAQLSGAIVVDEPGAAPPRDRVLVIGMWADTAGTEDTRGRGEHGRLLFVVNGRSWPHTERLSYAVGDTVRWRVVNTSADVHPMHLHGFYYWIDARGDALVDTVFAEDRRDLAVTDVLRPGRTMRLTWVPERPGNWLFHCHTTAHFSPRGPLGMPRAHRPASAAGARAFHAGDHALDGMSGLVVGIVVAPRDGAPVAAESAPDPGRRRLRLIARPSRGGTDERPLYSFALLEGGAEPPPDSGVRPGPPIVLVRGVPVGITVVNRTPEPTIVHWHGIELESYF
ncbi:MAG TPA: multicopper oxidase domain-containing protein, partial [Gemmatimonadaceae bacterium]